MDDEYVNPVTRMWEEISEPGDMDHTKRSPKPDDSSPCMHENFASANPGANSRLDKESSKPEQSLSAFPDRYPNSVAKDRFSLEGPGPPMPRSGGIASGLTDEEPKRTEEDGIDAVEPRLSHNERTISAPTTNPATITEVNDQATAGSSVGQQIPVESIADGMRTLRHLGRTLSIPSSQTPRMGSHGFGYYVKDKENLLYFPVGDPGPSSLVAFSDFPPIVVSSMHQVMSTNLAERFNGEWDHFALTMQSTVAWLSSTDTDEDDRMAQALYLKASRDFAEFKRT